MMVAAAGVGWGWSGVVWVMLGCCPLFVVRCRCDRGRNCVFAAAALVSSFFLMQGTFARLATCSLSDL